MIFVQIASYRDPELLPTIVDCLSKAKYPNDLTFGICWQKHPKDRALLPLKGHKRFRIDEVSWHESRGVGWARSRIQNCYAGEEFTLQLHSHHRFCEHWDAKLLEFLEHTGSPKPMLSSYAGVYDRKTNQGKTAEPNLMLARSFSEEGIISLEAHALSRWAELQRPVRARFVSGHFFFTLGIHCHECRYDPNLYFGGDEMCLSIRSFTLGYDLFHPHRSILWHEYTRQERAKHWNDHVLLQNPVVGQAWHELDAISKKRVRKLLGEEENDQDLTGYDLGAVRSRREYEIYAGIDFAERKLHRDTIAGLEPPCIFENAEQWKHSFATQYELDLSWNISDVEQCEDLGFMYFGVEDNEGRLLYRYDARPESPEALRLTSARHISFCAESSPATLVVWPNSSSKGWLRKTTYPL